MSVLSYPPMIEGKLPAFVQGKNPGTTTIIIPFLLNRVVSRNDFNAMSLKITTVTGNRTQVTIDTELINYNAQTNNYYATFVINNSASSTSNFIGNIGQYYKAQVAFKNTTKTGNVVTAFTLSAWSSVGVIKCTAEPVITLDTLDLSSDNINYTYFTGKYINSDRTERVYSYSFTIYDKYNNIHETSGELIHNTAENDTIVNNTWQSYDTWHSTKSLRDNMQYTIIYSVTTNNGYNKSSHPYRLKNADVILSDFNAKLLAIPDYDNGCIQLQLIKPHDQLNETELNGNFVINRYSENLKSWNEVCKFSLHSQFPSEVGIIWTDYTIEHGERYQYAIQRYNSNGLYSSKVYNVIPNPDPYALIKYLEVDEDNNPYYITADFEDSFLTDDVKQLKIRFNPQVSSFKPTILESKLETLGGQYPFIFRNGNVNYKEFSIGGLLSYLSDEKELFMQGIYPEAISLNRTRTAAAGQQSLGAQSNKFNNIPENGAALTSENFYRERQFKTEVLEWLTNGKPKLFRSPGEGNFIVRLMNVSLSPNDTVGRMIHTFTATAYEVAAYNFDNLKYYNLIHLPDTEYQTMKFISVKLSEHGEIYQPHNMYNAYITNALPGTRYEITFDQMTTNNPIVIEIGSTGAYYIDIDTPIASIKKLSGDNTGSALLHYGYYDSYLQDEFSLISKITTKTEVSQFIGQGKGVDLLAKCIDGVRKKLNRIISITIEPRPIIALYPHGGKYYLDKEYHTEFTYNKMDQALYYDYSGTGYFYSDYEHFGNYNYRITPDFKVYLNTEELELDVSIGNAFTKDNNDAVMLPPVSQDNKKFEKITWSAYELTDEFESFTRLAAGSGAIVTIAYSFNECEYILETTVQAVINAKDAWKQIRTIWLANEDFEKDEELHQYVFTAYNDYINILRNAIAEYENHQED